MNPYGSYRALLGNGIAALSAAIEIYNKPKMDYRDECAVILLVNAWELVLKAALSKNRVRIYYKKKRGHPYRTYSISDALNRATPFFPVALDFDGCAKNLELLVEYRDNAIHFYNEPGFGVIMYSLAQTAVVNFRDFVKGVFDKDVAEEITLALLPIALAPPVDPVEFLRTADGDAEVSASVKEFTTRLKDLVVETEEAGCDTGRLLTTFRPALESTKKIASADFVVGVDGQQGGGAPVLVNRRVDPNRSHPYREGDIIASVAKNEDGMGIDIGGEILTQYPFRAIGHFLKVKEDPRWCWADRTGAVTRYSQQYVDRLRQITPDERDRAVEAYRNRNA